MPSETIIFADGASSGNPGPGGWGAILAMADGRVRELGGAEPRTTNNRMELMAVIEALRTARSDGLSGPVSVYTDSLYVIRGITQWVHGWRRNGWKTGEGEPVANQDLWQSLMEASAGMRIGWKYVPGHAGIPGNERVDRIAVAFSRGEPFRLFEGPLSSYGIAIHEIPADAGLPAARTDRKPKAAVYSYLSVIDGVPMRHSSWPECEQRVKGRSGAKFKKAMNAEEEAEILASWGYAPQDPKNSRQS